MENNQENNFTNRMQAAKKKKKYGKVKNLGAHYRSRAVVAAPEPPAASQPPSNIDIVAHAISGK